MTFYLTLGAISFFFQPKAVVLYQCQRCDENPFISLARLTVHYEDHHPENMKDVQPATPVCDHVVPGCHHREGQKHQLLHPVSEGQPPSSIEDTLAVSVPFPFEEQPT